MKEHQAVTCGIFYCRDIAEINGCGSLQTSSRVDSDVLRNRQQKHTANRQTAQKHQRMFFRDKLNLRENRLFNSCICVDYFVTLCCKSINYNLCNTYREKSEISYRFFVWNR